MAEPQRRQPRLIAPGKKAVKLAPVQPNSGVEAAYRKRLESEIDAMHRSIEYWITAAYRAEPPATMATDESAASYLNRVMQGLARRWNAKFRDMSDELGRHFATQATERADGALKSILKRGGWTVGFKLTAPMNDALQATIAENVGLIRSIGEHHLQEVQGLVMRSVAAGRDIGTLREQLQARYGITKRRAALCARDQTNKATATTVRVRQESLGIVEAIWRHSGGGRHPRPKHLAADGQRYEVSKGLPIGDKGEWVLPGQEVSCRCMSISIIPALDDWED